MPRHSLQQALARCWMAFAAVLSLSSAVIALLLLFLLEDSFIDRRLRAVAATVVDPAAPAPLPVGFQVLAWPDLPADLRAPLAARKSGAIAEFRRSDGRYVHALSTRSTDGRPFVLVYDVTDELTINPRLSVDLVYALALLLLSRLGADGGARTFISRAVEGVQGLMRQGRASPDPQQRGAVA